MWARLYLVKAELLSSPRRGYVQITPTGQQVLRNLPANFDINFLKTSSASFREFLNSSEESQTSPARSINQAVPSPNSNTIQIATSSTTPEESLELAHEQLRSQLIVDLQEQLLAMSPAFFERLVVELLVKMGYGGSREAAGKALGKSGDGGVDGVINEDPLGLDTIYIQAKRYIASNKIGRPDIQAFVGALQGQRSRKGVFITTSAFTQEAVDYVKYIDTKVILIDGQQLAKYMIDYNLGVTTVNTYHIKRIDSDYFTEE